MLDLMLHRRHHRPNMPCIAAYRPLDRALRTPRSTVHDPEQRSARSSSPLLRLSPSSTPRLELTQSILRSLSYGHV